MTATKLHIGMQVTYTIDDKTIPAEVLAIINTRKCKYNNAVYIELDQKINGCKRIWVGEESLS